MNGEGSGPDKFIATSIGKMRRSPARESAVVTTQPLASIGRALASAALGYLALPEILGVPRAGPQDEASAVFLAISTYLASRVPTDMRLCHTDRERKRKRAVALGAGAAAGAMFGAAIVPLTAAALLSPLDGGIMLLATATGLGGAHAANSGRKTCPYEDCEEPGRCTQRVCRGCFRLFYPLDVDLRSTEVGLNWAQLASYLQRQGFDYFDSEQFVKKYWSEWRILSAARDPLVDRDAFAAWVSVNKDSIADFRFMELPGVGAIEKRSALDSKGL